MSRFFEDKNTKKIQNEYKKYSFLFLFLASLSFVGFFVVPNAFAATGINKQISFQGKVVNTDGTNVAGGSYTFLFCIYTTPTPATACTSGADNDAVWRESKSITVTDGIFQTNLGDTTAFASLIDFNTDNIYLGINFNANGQMSPLVRFTATPYALNAAKVGGLTVTDTTGTLTIPNGKTISFADAFTTTGAFPLTLTSTASTTATLPAGTVTLVDLATSQSLTNKTIGSTGLVFSGATTDITTASGESLVIVAAGAGTIDLQDATTVDSLTTDTGGVTIASGQSYSGSGAVTLASASATALTLNSGTNGTINIGTDASAETINIGNTGAAAKTIAIGNNTQANTITIGDASVTGLSLTDNNWSISTAGAAAFASLSSSGAIAANGGITFDASTDTVGAFTSAGTIDMSTNILTNIGNAGTDFVASTGALTLAGILTANGGISLPGSQSLAAAALSYVDLGLITHSSTANQGLRLPNAPSATPSNPTSGEGYLAWDATGNQLIAYNGSAWTTVGGAGVSADSLDFTEFQDQLDLDASTDILAPSGQAYVLSITNEGTGNSFRVNDANTDTTPFVIDASGNVGIGDSTPDALLDFDFTSTSGVGATEQGAFFTISDTGVVSSGSDDTYGTRTVVTRTGATGGNITAFGNHSQVTVDNAGGGNSVAYAFYGTADSADSNFGGFFSANGTSATGISSQAYPIAGNGTGLDLYVEQLSTTTANINTGINLLVSDGWDIASGTDTTYGINASVGRTGATTGTIDTYGINLSVSGDTGGASTATGLAVAVSGADTNYSGLFTGGNFGIGDTTPSSLFSVGATSQFQVNSTGAIAAATGITSSGTITFSGLSTAGIVTNTAGGVLGTTISVPVANGGTNATTIGSAGSIAYSTGTAYAFSAVGTAGQALVSGGTGVPTFFAPTAGSILFAGTSGILQQDNANFFFDNASNELGLGTASPSAQLDIFGTTNALRLSYDVSNYASLSSLSDGTLSLTSSNVSESQFVIGTGSATDDSVAFDGSAQDYYAGLDHTSGYFTIGTGFTVGTSTLFALDSTGNVGIGTGVTAPGARLDISKSSTSTTGATEYSLRNTFSDTGVVSSGTDSTYGSYSSLTRTGATGGTINSYGNYTTVTADNAGAGASAAYGQYASATGADFNYGSYSIVAGTTSNVSYGSAAVITDFTTGANTNTGFYGQVTDSGIVTTGTDTNYGADISIARILATGGTIDTYGMKLNVVTDNAGAGTSTAYGISIDTGTSGATNADTVYGLKIATEANAGTAYGLYVDAGTQAGTEYAGIFMNGNVGVGDATPDALLDLDFVQTSGALFGIAAPSAVTLAGDLTGQNINLSTGVTATGRSITGTSIALPAVTNTGSGTYDYRGVAITSGAITQNTGTGINSFVGVDITNPNITATTGGIVSNGLSVTTGSITTGGAQRGLNITATGVGAGTLNGVSISTITGGAGTENAIVVGAGWDTYLDTTSIDISGAGAITGATGVSTTTVTATSTIDARGDISDSTGNLTLNDAVDISGALVVSGTSLTATSATTITLGSSGADTIILGNAGADTITIGNVASTGVSIVDNNWSVTTGGVATFITGSVIGSQTFTTNNIADSGALTIASGSATALTLNSGTNGAINIGTDASAETINIGNTGAAVKTIAIGNNTQANTITIGDATVTGLSLTDNNWSISAAGAAAFASLSSSGAIAANGGITFDASTDTVGAHTLSGTVDANTNIFTNIGNAGTDFVASTGALTLAGILTANGGISLAGSQSFTASALAFMDLGSITQSSTANQGLRLPQAASATPSNPTSGEGYLAWDAAGNQLITYNGSAWTTLSGGSGYNLIKDETTGLTARTTLAFLGAGVSCADNVSQTECTISGGGSSDLQATYGADADGSNATISLTAADDGLVFTNPTSGGNNLSTFLLQLDQAHTTDAIKALDIVQASNAANAVNITANAIDTETGLAITTNGLISGKGISVDSSSTGLTGNLASFSLTGSDAGNTGAVVNVSNSGASNTNVALAIAQNGSGSALKVNNSGTGNLAQLQNNGVDKVTFGNNGALTINGVDSTIVRNTTTEFAAGTVGSNLSNSANRLQLSDGSPANSGQGTITTASQPATPSNIGAGAMSITRPNGKYLIINGGSTGTTQVYDPMTGTITASQTITCNGTTTVGVGAIALPQTNGLYTIICGVAASTTTATSIVDPQGNIGSRIGPALATAVTGAGTVAYKRPNGKYLVTIGASTPGSATNIFDPVANTFVAGPAGASGTWTTGALALPMPDGRALIVNGGSTSTTNIYNPNGVSATIGTFTVGPSLDGVKTAGTCGINGSGSVAIKRQDGKYVILSKASVYALFDPSAMTMTCNSSVTNVSALGDGAHAIPIQNGKFLIFAGGNTTTAFVYNPDSDSFSTYSGTAPTAITTGAHSILRPDGKWQIITGTNTCTNGCTNSFDTGLPMSDPFPSVLTAAAPSAGGSCTAGTHSYYTTFIMSGSVESELSNKSSIVSCTASSGTVALSVIPVGPDGTTSRKVYRTTAGDASVPKLLTTIADNTTTTYSDTTADGSLGADYSVTAATTWYTSEDISSSYLGVASTIRWTAQLEATYAAMSNSVSNTAYRTVQFYVKTAVNSSGCATPLAAAPWQEIQSSGDSIRTVVGANCVKISIHFNRAMPKKLYDDRGTWTGNNTTVLRYDYTTPTLFDYSIDNSAVMKRTAWDFVDVTSAVPMATTVPSAPTSAAPSGTGSCTSGNHFWFVTFVINGAESNLSPASTVRSCSGSNLEPLTSIPIGPSGTTARKIYRTAAGFLVTDTPFLVTTISDNSTTTYDDALADSALGAAYAQLTPSGPTLSRAEGSRVEASNNQLTLPWGRITPTTAATLGATVGLSYSGLFGSDHPTLTNTAGPGTFVIARDDKTFLVVEGGGATAELYDPATQTFTNQTATGDKPTATVGVGAFAIKRPNGKYLVILGNNTTTTNIYDQYAPPGSRFTAGPTLTGTAAHQGAFAMQNADGTWTILPGNAATTTSIYDPVRNTMTVGPLQTTGTNFGALAIPLSGPNANIYKVINGTTVGGAVSTTTMNYNSNTKIFTAGQALTVGVGNGATAFQRQDGFWILLRGESAANTLGTTVGIINPVNGTDVAGTALSQGVNGRGTTVIPRADGTFLITSGTSMAAATTPGSSVLTVIYFPWGGATGTFVGTPVAGASANGPAMPFQGTQSTAITAPTTSAPASGGTNQCDTGTHLWRYTQVINGVETALSLAGTVQTCTVTTLGQESLTAIAVGPTGTSARKVYRTKAGTTSPYFLVTTINDNTTTTYADSASDASLGAQYWSGGAGDGAVSFQRPDGKFVTIYGGASWTTPLTEIGSKMVSIYDAGWYADGQYLSEQMSVPALAANSTLEWQQTSDQYVRMAIRTGSSQSALGAASYTAISNPGGSIGNAGGETWAQVQVNFRRDFPTFGYNQNGVYLGSGGGLAYPYRNISIPTVNSFQITNGMDLVTLQNNGLNIFRVTTNGSILSSSQGGFYSGGADLAENYTSTESLEKGEVVMIDQANPEAVLRATGQYQNNIIGVVSTKPGFVAGGYTENSYPVALVGRVPVRVSTENGPIQAGDTLTSASIPGYAMKATLAGRSLGRSLEAFDPATATSCPSQGMGNYPETKCGSVMMFVNLANYYGAPIELAMSDEQLVGGGVDGGLDTPASQVENDGLLTSSAVRLAVSIPTKEQAMLDYLKRLHDSRVASGAPTSEVLADRISATGEIISPTIIADTIFAKRIKADQIEGLQVFTDALSSLSEKYAGLSAPAVTDPTQTPVAQQQLAVAMKNLSVDTLAVQLDGSILGKLSVTGALQIGGAAQFDGDTVFSKLANFLGDTFFHGNVVFDKVPTFGTDTAGFAIIKKDEQRVRVTFEAPYPRQPIVAVTLTNDQSPLLEGETDAALIADVTAVEQDYLDTVFDADLKYVVTEKSATGFTIVLNKKAPYELQFSWVAIAVKRATTAVSQGADLIPEVKDPPVPNPLVEPTPSPTEETSSDPVVPEPVIPVDVTPDASPLVESPSVEVTDPVITP